VRTTATRIGRAVPTEFGGAVRAVWRRALAIAPVWTAGGQPSPALVTLVRLGVPMTAASVELDLGPEFDFSSSGIRDGDRVTCDGATIAIHSPRGMTAEADLREAAVFEGRPAEDPVPIAAALLGPLVAAAQSHRSARGGCGMLGARAAESCDALLETLALCVRDGDALAAHTAASSLVGLGPGLTPSGDDMLCGFMLGRRLSGDSDGAVDAAIRRVASTATGRTTDVSAVQLGLAADRRFGEALLRVSEVLCAGRSAAVSTAVVRCLAEGATSGADGLLGLAAGAGTGAAGIAKSESWLCVR